MAIFTKAIIGSAVAGTIALGAMVTYDGGSTVDSAKEKITEAARQIGIFKTNETALVSKVSELKVAKATLETQVADLEVELAAEKAKNTTDNERIIALEAEIDALELQIADLETEIAAANASLENAAGNTAETVERINALEAELNKANEKSEELQYTLDTTVLESPDQTAVDAALDGEVIIPDTGEGDGGGTTPDPSTYDENVKMVSGVPWTLQGAFNKTTFDVVDGNVTVANAQGYNIVVNGKTVANQQVGIVGTPAELDGTVVIVTDIYNQTKRVLLTNN